MTPCFASEYASAPRWSERLISVTPKRPRPSSFTVSIGAPPIGERTCIQFTRTCRLPRARCSAIESAKAPGTMRSG